MNANAPEKIWIDPATDLPKLSGHIDKDSVEYIRADAFIEKACVWIKENITNNPNANSVLVRNGCVTLGMLVENFKKYMEGEEL